MASPKRTYQPDPAVRRFCGVALLILSVFLALSVFSYDWRDVSVLRSPPRTPPYNLIGPLGARVSFLLFVLMGVGAYSLPAFTTIAGVLVLRNMDTRVWPRLLWLLLVVLTVPLAIDLRPAWWEQACLELNIADAGGVLGYLVTQSLLVRWLSPVGAGLLVFSVLAAAVGMVIGRQGFRTIATLTVRTAHGMRQLALYAIAAIQRVQQHAPADPPPEEPVDGPPPRKPPKRSKPPKKSTKPTPPAKPPEPRNAPDPPITPQPTPTTSGDYALPPISLLDEIPSSGPGVREADTARAAEILESTLSEFGIDAQVTNFETGPVVTRYEVLPAPGIRIERIANLQKNLALSLKAHSIRVQAPIPGKGVVGVEIPNPSAETVYLRQILEGARWKRKSINLPLALGKDVSGADIVADLARMPHLLIAGATGSGKTVCMNAILAGLLMSRTPDDLKLMLIDPKIVEFSAYNHLPHLVIPVVTDAKKVALSLRWAIEEMERRYKLFNKVKVRNIESFNSRVVTTQTDLFEAPEDGGEQKTEDVPAKVPYIVIVIDELADLMLAAGAEIENSIARLAQLSRAVGIHMIIATQRPSVNVITGTIKANFPARIAFQVAQKVDSRTILDTGGAETLLGRGDMLLLPPSTGKLVRGQGALVNDREINAVVDFIKQQATPDYEPQIQERMEAPAGQIDTDADDELLPQAIEIIREQRRASTSSLQRRLRIGYNRAGRLMDVLEKRGIVGPPRGSDPREILIDLDGDIPNNAKPDAAPDDGEDVVTEETDD